MTTDQKMDYLKNRCEMTIEGPEYTIMHTDRDGKTVSKVFFSGNWRATVTFFRNEKGPLFQYENTYEHPSFSSLVDNIYQDQKSYE